jgi:hypothetical protein
MQGDQRFLYAKHAWFAGCLLVGGCYHGIGGANGSDDAQGDDAADDGGGSDEDGDRDYGEIADPQCPDPVGASPLRRLTRSQYTHVVHDLLGIETDVAAGFSPDEKIGAFYSNGVAPISDLGVEKFMDAAEGLAEEAVADLAALHPCDPLVVGENACVDDFIDTIGRRVFRRPVRDDEHEQLRGVYATASAAGGSSAGYRLVLQTMLQSPFFVYHMELGEPDVDGDGFASLTAYEVASRLSFFLWDTMPDDALLDAAEDGSLLAPGGLRAQAERLLADPRAKQGIASFHLQWLGVDDMSTIEKDAVMYPGFDAARKQALQDETADFADWVLRTGDGSLETLLTAPFTIIDERLASFYGVTLPPDHVAGEPVDLDPTQRAGLLTQASLLAVHAHTNQSSPVHRGVLVRQNFLCQPLPPVPDDVDNVPPDPSPDATTRQRFAEHTADPTCAACHSLIDGLGFGFEHYDGVGAWRATDSDLPVDASGEIIGTTEIDGSFDGAIELAERLASSSEVRACLAQQWFNFALGRVQSDGDRCSTDLLYARFEASGWNVRELVLALVEARAFRMRRLDSEGK